MAYHGGWLEKTTDVIAAEVAERTGASCYTVIQPEGMERHIPVDPHRPGPLRRTPPPSSAMSR